MNFWHSIERPIIGLSPMDGVTDASFRFIAAKHGGPDVSFTEFVNVEAAFFAPQTLIKDLTYSEIERPVVAQIYGHTPELFYKAAHIVCELGFDGLDINMGCPAKRVAAKGSGAALIRTPELARSIVRAARRGVRDWSDGQALVDLELNPQTIEEIGTSNRLRSGTGAPAARRPIPVSVKTRLGYDEIVVDDWMQTLLEEKPSAISLHGRTLKQGYKGSADWDAIARAAEIARSSGTLILGNGDLQDPADIHRRVRESGVDGVLLGRSAQGDPWIFGAKAGVKKALRANEAPSIEQPLPALDERFSVMLEHSGHFESHWGAHRFVGMRKHLAWYCRGFRRAAELRSRLVQVKSAGEVARCLADYERQVGSRFMSQAHDPAACVSP